MGNNINQNRMEREQSASGRLAVHSVSLSMQLPYLKRTIQMAQIKWALILADIFGIPVTILGIIQNWDNIRSAILFLVGLTYLMSRLYFYVIQRRQAVREKEIDLWFREQDKQDRINKTKK